MDLCPRYATSPVKYDRAHTLEYEYNIDDELGGGWMHTIEYEGEVKSTCIRHETQTRISETHAKPNGHQTSYH